jgi:hypothetical protein
VLRRWRTPRRVPRAAPLPPLAATRPRRRRKRRRQHRSPAPAAPHPQVAAAQQHAAPDPPRAFAVGYTNIYGRIKCYADAVVRPTSTEQLAAAVKQLRAASAAAGKSLKIRVSRSVFHGTPTFGCPGFFGPGYGSPVPFTQPYDAPPFSSAAAPTTAAVLIDALDQVTAVDRPGLRVTVQVGRRIDRFLKWAEENGFSMERGAPSTYAELSISGVIATGGHGVGHNVTCNMVRARRRAGGRGGSGIARRPAHLQAARLLRPAASPLLSVRP